jgi:hypothetical protein
MPEHRVDRGLISPSLPAKKAENIGVEAQRDLFLPARPTNGMFEKTGTEFRNFRQIDL